jgi:hypothetical protein
MSNFFISKEEDCQILWCKVQALEQADPTIQCVTSNTKWADGTRCGISGPNVCIYFILV